LIFEEKGRFEIETTVLKETVDLQTAKSGVNETPNYFFFLDSKGFVEWVISRACDHRYGKLALQRDGEHAICPRHGWSFSFTKLCYTNIDLCKKKQEFEVEDNILRINHCSEKLVLPNSLRTEQPRELKIRFISHACLAITVDNVTLLSDPWIAGPAVRNSWWHSLVPSDDALDILFNADLVFISHNHSDHLNYETLSLLAKNRKSMPFIFPGWESESVGRVLSEMGFTDLFPATFGEIYQVSNILVSVFESGDFKEDGGLYFSSGNFSGLLTADSAILNKLVLPEVDFLATGFVGSASAFPWCFDNFTDNEKRRINMRGVWAAREEVRDYINATNPKFILPYAGYSTLNLPYDKYLRDNTISNSVSDIKRLVDDMDGDRVCIEPSSSLVAEFDRKKNLRTREESRQKLYQLDSSFMQRFLDVEENECDSYKESEVVKYFEESRYDDNLVLYVIPTDIHFLEESIGFIVDFGAPAVEANIVSREILNKEYEMADDTARRHLFIKARKSPFWKTIHEKRPWGEFIYHCRIRRRPNIYNASFWEHFSNSYIMANDVL
jgi:CMP-N-acetylneuraminate monooxygenase